MMIVISSGHGLKIRGASGLIDEVDEARKVVDRVAEVLSDLGVETVVYHDDVSTSQSENLERIVDFHNSQDPHDLDVSVHFNAYEPTDKPMGVEVLFLNEEELAEDLSAAMAGVAGFINRGAKYRDDLYFLNNTAEPAILIETCFVDSTADVELYEKNFEDLCRTIAGVLAGNGAEEPAQMTAWFSGKVSWFGGPEDTGVSPSEGLAFIYDYDDAPDLFLDEQPPGTSGLARRLDPEVHYVACRWDYEVTPKTMLADQSKMAIVRAKKSGRTALAHPADWGPHGDTDRAADISPGLMDTLGLSTDDEVDVLYPAPRRGT